MTTVKVDGGGVEKTATVRSRRVSTYNRYLAGRPGAEVTLVSVPDLSDASILDGYAYIVDKNKFDLVNSSFGGCELEYTAPFNQGVDFTYILAQYHEIFQQGTAQGIITFSASSGDEGALLCPWPGTMGVSGAKNVHFPIGRFEPCG